MSKKHKEVKKWVAGLGLWSDEVETAQAILVETPKQFRLKEDQDGKVYRLFLRHACSKKVFKKDHGWDMSLLHNTEENAIRALQEGLRTRMETTKRRLEAEQRVFASVAHQINTEKWRRVTE
jgi:hypothetical protein